MGRYRKKPVEVEVEAWQWDGENDTAAVLVNRILSDGGLASYWSVRGLAGAGRITICTVQGKRNKEVQPYEFVIRKARGHWSVCKPDVFEATYEAVNDD